MEKSYQSGKIFLSGKYFEDAFYDVASDALRVTFGGRGGIADYAVVTIDAPDLSGIPLANLIKRTLAEQQLSPQEIAAVIGHGTGTLHNDASELAAMNQVFTHSVPLLSIKGFIGHTLGATGVLQIVYGLEFIKRRLLPPQAGLLSHAEGAEHFVSDKAQPLRSNRILSVNVGFGGLNSTIIVEGPDK